MRLKRMLVVENELGLHARPAAELSKIAARFKADIVLCGNGLSANANSILSLLMLGAAKGTTLTVTADGVDALDALSAIRKSLCLS